MSFLWIAFVLGITGGLHCAAMCGAIAVLVPGNKWNSAILYNTGRLITYAVLGFMVALAGLPVKWLVGSQLFSVFIGITIMLVAVFSLMYKHRFFKPVAQPLIRKTLGKVWKLSPVWSPLLIGMLNGLLPCGLLYMAVTASAGMMHPLQSALFMAVFALATWPALLLVWMLGKQLKSTLIKKKTWLAFTITFLFGAVILVRGINGGIPFLSPEISAGEKQCSKLKCCHE